MLPKHQYGHLPVSDTCDGSQTPDSIQVNVKESSSRRWLRSKCLLCFVCGVLFGIATTCASKLLIGAFSGTLELMSPEIQPARHSQSAEIQNGGTIFRHEESDPTCGGDWREAEAAGCRYDIMASRWYSNECFNDKVLNQMLTEVSFDWVL
jgi:hypothetical protein